MAMTGAAPDSGPVRRSGIPREEVCMSSTIRRLGMLGFAWLVATTSVVAQTPKAAPPEPLHVVLIVGPRSETIRYLDRRAASDRSSFDKKLGEEIEKRGKDAAIAIDASARVSWQEMFDTLRLCKQKEVTGATLWFGTVEGIDKTTDKERSVRLDFVPA